MNEPETLTTEIQSHKEERKITAGYRRRITRRRVSASNALTPCSCSVPVLSVSVVQLRF